MGVDVSAIGNARPARKHDRRGRWCWKRHHGVHNEISPELLDGRPPGCYLSADGGPEECFGFRAGSYTGFGEFRDAICRLATGVSPKAYWRDPDRHAGRPFVELLGVADTGGAIGPVTSAKLYKDFKRLTPTVKRLWRAKDRQWMVAVYSNFQKAFRIAKDGGFVILH